MENIHIDSIVCWNGIITKYSVIKYFIQSSDRIKLANQEEINRYFQFQK